MKKYFLILLFISSSTISFAQKATLNVTLANSIANEFSLSAGDNIFQTEFTEAGDREISLNKKKSAILSLKLKKAGFYNFSCIGRNDKEDLFYSLFIEPGNQINIKVDFNQPDFGIHVSGKGAENNQPAIAFLKRPFSVQKFYGDSIPNRIINSIKKEEVKQRNNFNAYIKKYRPTKKFISTWQLNQKYFAPETYLAFKENNWFKIKDRHNKMQPLWDKIQDSLFNEKSLNNNIAIYSPNYLNLIENFVGRKREKLWDLTNTSPEAFFQEWYNLSPKEGILAFSSDPTNLLEEKIINRYFSGQSAEMLYMKIFDNAIDESNYKNTPQIFERFKSRFPKSRYTSWVRPYIDAYLEKERKPLNDKMIFVKNNGTDLRTLEEVLILNKGKTMLLDMWGTWCGPCRSELEANGEAIKDHFKGKGLDYLYIANYDTKNESNWKKLIPYFNMEGIHILADPNLTKDIMDKVKGNGYPTYVIIKKDGTYELSKAGFPMDREVLIKQLEEALAP
jgi:thiol-disulfide isomerase/thioredoxin